MKRFLVSLFSGLVLAVPLAAVVGHNPYFRDWMTTGHGWSAFDPLLDLFGVVGVEGEGNVVVNTLVCVSFILSFAVVWFGFGAVARMKQRETSR